MPFTWIVGSYTRQISIWKNKRKYQKIILFWDNFFFNLFVDYLFYWIFSSVRCQSSPSHMAIMRIIAQFFKKYYQFLKHHISSLVSSHHLRTRIHIQLHHNYCNFLCFIIFSSVLLLSWLLFRLPSVQLALLTCLHLGELFFYPSFYNFRFYYHLFQSASTYTFTYTSLVITSSNFLVTKTFLQTTYMFL